MERVNQRLEALGMTRNAAEMLAFGKPGTIRNWERADKSVLPRVDTLVKLAPVLQTTTEWLLTGIGSPEFRKRSMIDSFEPDHPEEFGHEGNGYAKDFWSAGKKGILPEVDTKLGAGEGTNGPLVNISIGNHSISAHPVIAEWQIPINYLRHEAKASPEQTIVMEIIGDSMFPIYLPGDRVLVDLSQNRLLSDTVYAISDGYGEPQIKRLQRIPFSNPPKVSIISDNQALRSFDVDLEDLIIIGRICGLISRR